MPNSTALVPKTPLTTQHGRLEEASLSTANQQKQTTIPVAQSTPLTNTPTVEIFQTQEET